jgi:hypothetical protein
MHMTEKRTMHFVIAALTGFCIEFINLKDEGQGGSRPCGAPPACKLFRLAI